MGLRDTYAYAISVAKGKFDGSATEKDGKLHFVGSVKTEQEKNELWQAIKTRSLCATESSSSRTRATLPLNRSTDSIRK